jgi:hypothetical protein
MHNEDKYFDTEQMLDEVFKTEPGFVLHDNFARRLAQMIDRKIVWRNYWNEFLIYLGAIAGLAVVWVGMSFLWFEANWKEWVNYVTSNIPLIAGISFLVVFILFADRVLLRYFLNKSSFEAN